MTLKISVVGPDRRSLALRLLFSRFPAEEQPARLEETLRSVERGSLNLDALFLAEENGLPVGATLMMPQADGVALVWPPVMSCQAADTAAVEQGLMMRLCAEIDGAGSKLAQCLLAPDDVIETALLQRHGFSHAADMYFLARPLKPADRDAKPDDDEVDHEIYCEASADQYASVIERTYVGSLDCPFLNDFRSGPDALDSHRLSGRYDPAGWRLYRRGSDAIGLLLMNEHPDQDAIELVYFGIVPEFRGQGLGRRVLSDGVQAAALTGRSVLFLAVDCGNTYANALYSELSFAELARRRVMLRRSPQLARK
jgi:mycothiol synthase